MCVQRHEIGWIPPEYKTSIFVDTPSNLFDRISYINDTVKSLGIFIFSHVCILHFVGTLPWPKPLPTILSDFAPFCLTAFGHPF
jgi:hypothetical protein